jgi:cobalt-zinc-cadmium efflux system membrane fusion protein
MQNKNYPGWWIFLSGMLLLAASCKDNSEGHQKAAGPEEQCILTPELKQLVHMEPVLATTISKELELTGSISYDQDHIFRYQSLVSGLIENVYFKMGDYVKKGQVLAQVRTTELSGQKSELHKAMLELKLAQRQLDATRHLHADGIASDKELVEAGNAVATVQAEIQRINETLLIQGGNIEKNVLIIRSPSNGYVVEKKITNGYQVQAGEDDLFVLSDLKKLWVLANVYPAQLGVIKTGQEVAIQTTAYPEKSFVGKISRLSNVFDPEEKVMKAIIEINNHYLELKSSMMVNVLVQQKTQQQAIGIPLSAAIFDKNSYHVVLYRSDCDIKNLTIHPVSRDKQFYYINTGELQASDTIITQNHLLVYEKLNGR